jgi:hypothetical protein
MDTCHERPRRLTRAGLSLVGSAMLAAAVVAVGAGTASPASVASHAAPAASAAAPAGGCIIVRCAE